MTRIEISNDCDVESTYNRSYEDLEFENIYRCLYLMGFILEGAEINDVEYDE